MSQTRLATPGAGTWTVPAGVTLATFRLLSAAGTGVVAAGGSLTGADGGGAGAYAEYPDVAVTEGDVLNFQIGTGGGNQGTSGTPGTTDTWIINSANYWVQGGNSNPPTLGGLICAGSPAVFHRGGSGGQGTGSWVASGGGGGAGGPHGDGKDGGSIQLFPFAGGGGGGGGADGGSDGQNSNFGSGPGGAGGANRLGVGGGAGGTSSVIPGAAGTAGGGGGGGWGNGAANFSAGGAGSFEALWGPYGPGSGGGGAGYSNNDANNGGDGGGRGGGGGGASPGGTAGIGQHGLIVITYRGSGSVDGRGRVYTRYVKTKRGGPRPPPAPPATSPVNSGSPVMNQARVGLPSTCSTGTWTGTAPITYAYQWKVDGSNVGTNSPSYTPASGDNGKSLKCTVTATNSAGSASHDSNAITVTNIITPSIDIPDIDALWAAQAAWPATGNKTWRLTGTDYGTLGAYSSWRFDSAPVIIDGLGTAKFQWIEVSGSSGITWQNFNVYGTNPSSGGAMWVHSDNTIVMNMTFNNVTVVNTDAMGTQTQGGWLLRNLDGSTITINGQNDNARPDMWGCTFGISMLTVGLGGSVSINGMKFDNMGINSILGGGVVNCTVNHCLFMNNFYGPGDHPNAVHFFGDGTRESQNITRTNNGVWQGLSGLGATGFFSESVRTGLSRNNWVLTGGQNGAFSNSAGSDETNDNNFAQGFGGWGGVMIARGGALNSINTNNTVGSLANYSADGVNPGYVPDAASYPGSNTLIPVAASLTDTTYLGPWLAAHPTARPKPF